MVDDDVRAGTEATAGSQTISYGTNQHIDLGSLMLR